MSITTKGVFNCMFNCVDGKGYLHLIVFTYLPDTHCCNAFDVIPIFTLFPDDRREKKLRKLRTNAQTTCSDHLLRPRAQTICSDHVLRPLAQTTCSDTCSDPGDKNFRHVTRAIDRCLLSLDTKRLKRLWIQ